MTAAGPCILILGCHRSGTSALSRCAGILGANMPIDLMGPGLSNVTGHWEPSGIVEVSDAFLASQNSSWADWTAIPLFEENPQQLDAWRISYHESIAASFPSPGPFALKDPRLCRIVPLVVQALASKDICVTVCLSHRHPDAVAKSLMARPQDWPRGFSDAQAYLIWLRHVLDAEYYSRSHPRVRVNYEDLMSTPIAALTPLATLVPGLIDPKTKQLEISEFLRVDLQHWKEGKKQPKAKNPYLRRIAGFLADLQHWIRGKEPSDPDAETPYRQMAIEVYGLLTAPTLDTEALDSARQALAALSPDPD